VRIRQSLGTRVQPVEHWNLLDADVVKWRLAGRQRGQQLRELVQMRLAVEPIAANLVAQARTAATLARLESAFARMQEALGAEDVHAFTEADVAFHAELLSGSGNQMFPLLTSLVATALEAREASIAEHHVDLSASAIEDHGAVLAAVRQRDSDAAEGRMRAMLRALLKEPHSAAGTSVEDTAAG
jgi:DNA-binding FadR family transcriptional regulator